MGMVDACSQSGFAFKLGGERRVVAPVFLQHFQGKPPFEIKIGCLVHRPHPAGAKEAFQFEGAEALKHRERKCALRTFHNRQGDDLRQIHGHAATLARFNGLLNGGRRHVLALEYHTCR